MRGRRDPPARHVAQPGRRVRGAGSRPGGGAGGPRLFPSRAQGLGYLRGLREAFSLGPRGREVPAGPCRWPSPLRPRARRERVVRPGSEWRGWEEPAFCPAGDEASLPGRGVPPVSAAGFGAPLSLKPDSGKAPREDKFISCLSFPFPPPSPSPSCVAVAGASLAPYGRWGASP